MSEAELPIELDRNSSISLAAQVASQLRAAILNGVLRPEHALPATRRLATELGISRGVVVRAFEQLSGEGFLESNGAGGTKVAVRPDIQQPPPGEEETIQHLAPGRRHRPDTRPPLWITVSGQAMAERLEIGRSRTRPSPTPTGLGNHGTA